MNIEFQYTQILPCAHPDFSVSVIFEVEADVHDNDDVTLLNLWAHENRVDAPWKGLSTPKAEFAEILRNAAREAAKQWQAENF